MEMLVGMLRLKTRPLLRGRAADMTCTTLETSRLVSSNSDVILLGRNAADDY